MDYTNFLVRNCPKTAMYIPNFITSEEEQRILMQIEKTPKPKWTQLSHRRLINYGGVPHPNGMIAEEIPNWLQLFIDKINNLGIFESRRANHVLVNEYLPGQGIMPHTDGPMFHPIISTISCGSHTVLEFYKDNSSIEYDGGGNDQLNEISSSSSSSLSSTTPITIDGIENEKKSLQISSSNQSSESHDDNSAATSNKNENCCKVSTDDDHGSDDDHEACTNRQIVCKLLIEPRSLLILKDSMYKDYLHAISERTEDTICDLVCNLENCENSYKYGDRIKRDKRISLTIRHVPKTSKLKLKLSGK